MQTRFATTVAGAAARIPRGGPLRRSWTPRRSWPWTRSSALAALDVPSGHLLGPVATAWPSKAGLKLREAAQSWTEAYPAMEYRHGPITIAAARRVDLDVRPGPRRTRGGRRHHRRPLRAPGGRPDGRPDAAAPALRGRGENSQVSTRIKPGRPVASHERHVTPESPKPAPGPCSPAPSCCRTASSPATAPSPSPAAYIAYAGERACLPEELGGASSAPEGWRAGLTLLTGLH